MKKIFNKPLFIKLFHWEYWSFNVLYAPVYFYWLYLGCKARSAFFFNTSNPTIKNGGFLMESKKEIYDMMPTQYFPTTLFFKGGTMGRELLDGLAKATIAFPMIAKPDIGMRGLCVEKINTEAALLKYAAANKVDFLVQEFIPFENEVGIFYYRYPNETKGHISGIVGKEFLTVTGDGISTIEQLLHTDKRFILQLATLQKTHADMLCKILASGEKYLVVPYGNHSRGAMFLDFSHLADEKLTDTIDTICKEIPGFYFGRMDIRYNTWEELRNGENFSIIELNGAGSEPTHMYDPKHSVFHAWKEIVRHLAILFEISKQNHRTMKIPYLKFSEGMKMLKDNAAYVKVISNQFS